MNYISPFYSQECHFNRSSVYRSSVFLTKIDRYSVREKRAYWKGCNNYQTAKMPIWISLFNWFPVLQSMWRESFYFFFSAGFLVLAGTMQQSYETNVFSKEQSKPNTSDVRGRIYFWIYKERSHNTRPLKRSVYHKGTPRRLGQLARRVYIGLSGEKIF